MRTCATRQHLEARVTTRSDAAPTYADDRENAALLRRLIARVPYELAPEAGRRFPLLDALAHFDRGTAIELVFVAAAIHREADERRTAEYLLRNRLHVSGGRRTAAQLLSAARCAAEMDVRRIRLVELSTAPDRVPVAPRVDANDEPAVADAVLSFLAAVIGVGLAPVAENRVRDAVVVAMQLAERHALVGGSGPAVYAMRSDARPSARLGARLQMEFGSDIASRAAARLLVGADDSPVDSSLLWWVAQRDRRPNEVPTRTRRRWQADVERLGGFTHASIALVAS